MIPIHSSIALLPCVHHKYHGNNNQLQIKCFSPTFHHSSLYVTLTEISFIPHKSTIISFTDDKAMSCNDATTSVEDTVIFQLYWPNSHMAWHMCCDLAESIGSIDCEIQPEKEMHFFCFLLFSVRIFQLV